VQVVRKHVNTCLFLTLSALIAVSFTLSAVERPILVLVSIDGWRWDYLQRFKPPSLTELASRGVVSDGLIPVFPSKTFPNHYTLVTGLYPSRHGIVSNNMRDPALPRLFSLGDVAVQQDTRWWGGIPLWVTAERQGQIAGTMFWPGSDVEIAGDRPAKWRQYDDDAPNDRRVDEVIAWLKEPEATRPTFVTLYFSEVDTAGHDYGPDSAEIAPAITHVDAAMARLLAGIRRAGLESITNVVVVSDHGMAQNARERTIVLDDLVDLDTVDVIDWSPVLGVSPKGGSVEDLYRALKDKHRALAVYRNEDLPDRYHLAGHPRYPAVIGIADDGWDIVSRQRMTRDYGSRGTHGYDPAHRSMHGLFIATGPAFRTGIKVPRFENVHVYELLCRVLAVRPEPNDGNAAVTASFFK
jgi:predicted AlkP superfamily pyrophosphatase or phosphodiesterase